MDNGLTYAKGYNEYDLNDFVGVVPIRELEPNEVLSGICQIKDESTGITHIGFVVEVLDTASQPSGSVWIGAKAVNWYQAFKVVSRDPVTKRQVKKRIYNFHKDFLTYSDKLIKRYRRYYDVEVYVLKNNKWELTKTYENDLEKK